MGKELFFRWLFACAKSGKRESEDRHDIGIEWLNPDTDNNTDNVKAPSVSEGNRTSQTVSDDRKESRTSSTAECDKMETEDQSVVVHKGDNAKGDKAVSEPDGASVCVPNGDQDMDVTMDPQDNQDHDRTNSQVKNECNMTKDSAVDNNIEMEESGKKDMTDQRSEVKVMDVEDNCRTSLSKGSQKENLHTGVTPIAQNLRVKVRIYILV